MNIITNQSQNTINIWDLEPGEVGLTASGRYLQILNIPDEIMPSKVRGGIYVVDIKTGIVEVLTPCDVDSKVARVDGSYVVNLVWK